MSVKYFVLCIAFVSACNTVQLEPLRLNLFGDFSDVIVNYGIESGIFRNAGFDVTTYFTKNGGEAIDAMHAGDTDFALTSPFVCVQRALEGADLRYLASIGTSQLPYAVISFKDKQIKSIKDLQGKRIAAPKGTQAEFYIHYALTYNEIDFDTITFIDILPQNAINALEGGIVDVVFVSEPFITNAKKLYKNEINVFDSNLPFNLAIGIVAKADYNRESAIRLIKAFDTIHLQLEQLFIHNPEEYARYAKMPLESLTFISQFVDMSVSLDHLLVITSESQARWLLRQNSKYHDFDISSIFDPGPIDAAVPGRSKLMSN